MYMYSSCIRLVHFTHNNIIKVVLAFIFSDVCDPPPLHTHTHTHTHRLRCNLSKNRYKDVVCYDESRVVLKAQPGVEGSDYVHANYVSGYNKPQAFILTQGKEVITRQTTVMRYTVMQIRWTQIVF